jgi:DNA-binding transcriptional ArsR family regulator
MDIKKIEQNVSLAAKLLKLLSNEKRLLIICTLYNEEKSVGELEEIVGLSQSALSQHLAKLRRDKIVSTRRKAQTIYYSISDDSVAVLLEALYKLYCED